MAFSKSVYFSFFVIVCAISCSFLNPVGFLNYLQNLVEENYNTNSSHAKSSGEEVIITKEELWEFYRGTPGSKGLYVGFFGKIYDVQEGSKHYGPGGGYHFFAGRDGTRAFISGDFTEKGLIDDIRGLAVENFLGIQEWEDFYETTYKYVGKIVGNFYDEFGQATKELEFAHNQIKKAEQVKKEQEQFKLRMPPCNSMTSQTDGSKVWCSKKSGGVDRDWVGFPRKYQESSSSSPRCICVQEDTDDERITQYPNCDVTSHVCIL